MKQSYKLFNRDGRDLYLIRDSIKRVPEPSNRYILKGLDPNTPIRVLIEEDRGTQTVYNAIDPPGGPYLVVGYILDREDGTYIEKIIGDSKTHEVYFYLGEE